MMHATETNQDFYRKSAIAVEKALCGPVTHFPITIHLGQRAYQFHLWQGQRLPDRLLAYDTETAPIQGREIPQLALATVHGDAGSAYLIHPDRLAEFIQQHASTFWCCHNAVFDFWVTAQHLGTSQANQAWWDIAGDGRLGCTMILDALIRLARIDAEPVWRGLDVVAKEYCGLELDKADPYRLRYDELIGLPERDWDIVEPGFYEYACKDPVATLQVMQRLGSIAQDLITLYHDQLLLNAWRRFGPLTVCLQVQGAIALDYISRMGVCVDVDRAHQLHGEIAALVKQHMGELERLGGQEVFKRYKKTGEYRLSKSGVAQRNAKLVKQRLEQIAKVSDEPVRPPRNKDGQVTDSVKYWKQHQHLDPFIGAYVSFSEQAKLMQFFNALKQDRIYPTYDPLKRTGRSSCRSPNLQQLPRDSRFREMIVAPPGYWLLQIDYSVLELCSLAQICLRRYGRSVLADLFRRGVDPHKYTAALLLGKTPEQFEQLPAAEQKQHRQRAKAVNVGTPGGLGAASLVAYAKQSYGVEMTFGEARQFRKRLITEVYSELEAYLRDQPHDTLMLNLKCTAAAARQAFSNPWQIDIACRIVIGCTESPKGDVYEQDLIGHVWLVLKQLNRNEQLQAAIEAKQPSLDLARRIFWGHALTISGRLRGHVGFSQRANTPFQSLGADGNKLALFRLLHNGYQVCGFIHDEMLVLIPDGADYDAAVSRVQQILCEAMQEFTPDIPIKTEYLLADRWYKGVDEQPRDVHGRIVPYQERPHTEATKPARQSVASPPEGTGLTKNKPAARLRNRTKSAKSTNSNTKSTKPKKRRYRPAYDPDSIFSFVLPRET